MNFEKETEERLISNLLNENIYNPLVRPVKEGLEGFFPT